MFLIYIDSVDYHCDITMLIWWFLRSELEGRKQGDVIKQAWCTFGEGGFDNTKETKHILKLLPLRRFYSSPNTWWPKLRLFTAYPLWDWESHQLNVNNSNRWHWMCAYYMLDIRVTPFNSQNNPIRCVLLLCPFKRRRNSSRAGWRIFPGPGM